MTRVEVCDLGRLACTVVHGITLSCLLSSMGSAALAADGRCDPEQGPCPPGMEAEEAEQEGWIDDSYEYVTARSDALAIWLDSFFGVPTADRESADSILRLRTEVELDEADGTESKIRLRGKVNLPQLNRRLSLVFSDEDEDYQEVVPDSTNKHNDVGVQLRLSDRRSSRAWFSLSTNSSLDLRARLRYKYIRMLGEDWRVQLGETLYWKQDDGFGLLSRVDLDYLLDVDRMVRWTNQVDDGEETAGAEWGSRLSYQVRLDSRQALSYFTAVSGSTDPDYLTHSYGFGVRYRRNVLRPWIFFEMEPSHVWRREGLEEAREPVWMLTFRLEFIEERANRHDRHKRRDRRARERAQAAELK